MNTDYPLEDALYGVYVQAVADQAEPDKHPDEYVSYRRYEEIRKHNRDTERADLAKLTAKDLYEHYEQHCARYPASQTRIGWQANGAAGARWFDQGRVMLALMSGFGRPASPVLMGATGTHS